MIELYTKILDGFFYIFIIAIMVLGIPYLFSLLDRSKKDNNDEEDKNE